MGWARRRARPSGVELQRVLGGVELRRGDRIVRVAAKHVFFVPQIAAAFDAFAYALPVREKDGVAMVDFATQPDALNLCRRCVKHGAVLETRDGQLRLRKGNRAMLLAPQHFIYAAEMAQNFDLYFEPLLPEERYGLQVVDFSAPGKLQTYKKSGLQFEMASFPEEEEAIEEYLRWYRPKAGDMVFDVGAHCGVSTYYFAKMVGPSGRVICFEPDPVNYALLCRNIERHGLENVHAEKAAIAGERGTIAFSSEGTIGSKMATLLTRDTVGETVEVRAMTLADAFEQWGVPTFCKIDIEGAEIEVIRSSEALLRERGTQIAMDTSHHKADGTPTAADIEEMLRRYGYEVESKANPLLTTWARPRPKQ